MIAFHRYWLFVPALLGVAPFVSTPPVMAAPAPTPNIIIIFADDLGYGDLSCYDGWVPAPHLERLAREGMRLTDFHSSGPVCTPTRAGLLTGRYQQRAGMSLVCNADPATAVHHHGLQSEEITFAEVLRDAGYAPALFGKWHLGYAPRYNPTHQGFARFRGFVSGNIDYISHCDRMGTYDWWEGREHVEEPGYLTHLITRHAEKFIEEHKDRPFCLYLAHGAVHTPLQAPDDPPQRGPEARSRKNKAGENSGRPSRRSSRETYRRMTVELDNSVGAVVRAIDEAGLAENTLVFFFSDNGGTPLASNQPLRGHKGQLFEGGHRVPAIARWPGRIPAGTTSDATLISLDLMPTMLRLAGRAAAADHPLDGVDISPVLLQKGELAERPLFWEYAGQRAMRDGPWKLILPSRGQAMLFNLQNDLAEQHDLAGQQPQRVARMRAALENWSRDVASGATAQPGRANTAEKS